MLLTSMLFLADRLENSLHPLRLLVEGDAFDVQPCCCMRTIRRNFPRGYPLLPRLDDLVGTLSKIFNFPLSYPQLFGLVACPLHRVPRPDPLPTSPIPHCRIRASVVCTGAADPALTLVPQIIMSGETSQDWSDCLNT